MAINVKYNLDTSNYPCYNIDTDHTKEVNEMPSDIQYKDELRKDLIMLERFKELANADKKDELIKELDKEIQRINASLQD